jgi:hypothetical protein
MLCARPRVHRDGAATLLQKIKTKLVTLFIECLLPADSLLIHVTITITVYSPNMHIAMRKNPRLRRF